MRAMRPFLIVKTGGTLAAPGLRPGDFEHWIAEAMGLAAHEALVADVQRGDALPPPREVCGIVVTGSTSMVTERLPWSERTAGWLRGAVEGGAAVLGICYGHQLLAHALGGKVARNPRGREIGTVEVRLTDAGRRDPLLSGLGEPLRVQATHVEAVVELPAGAEHLGETDGDAHQAFRVGARAWGVQFHPEFDAATIRTYLHARGPLLRDEGLDPEALASAAKDSDHGGAILRRFVDLSRHEGRDAPRTAAASMMP